MQIFVPSLPAIQESFGVSMGRAQLTLSVSMISIAVTTLAYGPIADRYGRRPVMIFGLLLFVVGTAISVTAPTIAILITGRALQAAGGASGMVLSRAIVRDLCGPLDAVRVIATLTMVMVSAPMVAPAIGGVLQDLFGWRATFLFAGLCGLAVFALVYARLEESNPQPTPFTGILQMVGSFGRLLRSPAYCGYAFHSAFSSVVFFTFVSAAPYIMVKVMGRPSSEYGFYFVLVTLGFMVGNFVTSRLTGRVGINRMIIAGSAIAVSALATEFALVVNGVLTPLSLFLPVMVAIFGNGMAMPSTQAGAINVFPSRAGTASGLSGFLQMAMAALASQGVAFAHDGTAFPMLCFMMAGAICAVVAITLGFKYGRPEKAG